MTGLTVFRTVSRSGVCLAGRHGSGADRPTDGKIKAPPSGVALVVGRTRKFCRLFALSCLRFRSTRHTFQRADRHRQTDAAENSVEHA